MFKAIIENNSIMALNRLSACGGKLVRFLQQLKELRPYSEDTAYKWHFIAHFLPVLYDEHTRLQYANCTFCANLLRTRCHKHCFQCRAGSYIYCSPVLPGILNCEDGSSDSGQALAHPWYFKEPCAHFRRLSRNLYWKNLYSPFSWVTIYNFEVLQGLLYGLSASEKPCHICAAVDYGIYQHCSMQPGFEKDRPCMKIAGIMESLYGRPTAALRQ